MVRVRSISTTFQLELSPLSRCGASCNCSRCCPQTSSSILAGIKRLLCDFYNLVKAVLDGDTLVSYNDVLATTPKVVSSVPARITFYGIFNTTNAPLYVKFYNIEDPDETDTPAMRLEIPAESGANVSGLNLPFDAAIAIRATAAAADSDNTDVATDALLINIGYRSL